MPFTEAHAAIKKVKKCPLFSTSYCYSLARLAVHWCPSQFKKDDVTHHHGWKSMATVDEPFVWLLRCLNESESESELIRRRNLKLWKLQESLTIDDYSSYYGIFFEITSTIIFSSDGKLGVKKISWVSFGIWRRESGFSKENNGDSIGGNWRRIAFGVWGFLLLEAKWLLLCSKRFYCNFFTCRMTFDTLSFQLVLVMYKKP